MEKESVIKRKRPDPLLLEKLELLQEMEKIEMLRDLKLIEELPDPPAQKERAPKGEKK